MVLDPLAPSQARHPLREMLEPWRRRVRSAETERIAFDVDDAVVAVLDEVENVLSAEAEALASTERVILNKNVGTAD